MKISRRAYAEMLGPTVGDKLRLADTALVIEIEQDLTLRAGGYAIVVRTSPADGNLEIFCGDIR